MTGNKYKGPVDLALQKKREAYQWRLSSTHKPSAELDLRMAKRADDDADALLTVPGNALPITRMGEVSDPHIAGLRVAGKAQAIDTLQYSGIIPEAASISRTDLLLQDNLDISALAIDAAHTIEASNSLEKMLAHQMALAHKLAMKTGNAAMRELDTHKWNQGFNQHRTDAGVEYQRLVNSTAKLMGAFQQGMMTLQKIRTGGSQTMTVQHVHVESGGQALIGTVQAGARPEGEMDQND